MTEEKKDAESTPPEPVRGLNKHGAIIDDQGFVGDPPPDPPERKPVVMLDPERLKPIDQQIFKEHGAIACDRCKKPEARWAFLPTEAGPDDDPQPVCSYCFLYDSGWGLTRRDQIDIMIKDVEEAMGAAFVKEPGGRMTNPRDCDRILGAIAYISRMYMLRNMQMMKTASKEAPEGSRIIQPASGGSGIIVPPMGAQFRIKP